MENRNKLAIELQAAGVNKIEIDFSGGGDEGAINGINIEMNPGFSQPAGLEKRLENWAYEYLETLGYDWCNNDGGCGQLSFDLTKIPPAFSGNVDQYEQVATTVWSTEDEMA